jgi:hypothetical protein
MYINDKLIYWTISMNNKSFIGDTINKSSNETSRKNLKRQIQNMRLKNILKKQKKFLKNLLTKVKRNDKI